MALFDLKDYIKPNNIQETLKLLSEFKGKAKIIAGGTVLHEL